MVFIAIVSFSQNQKTISKKPTFLQKPKEIYISNHLLIDSTGIQALSKNPTDTIMTDVMSRTIFYCVPDSTESFWYKMYIESDCEITFSIYPSGQDNIYNFFLYKHSHDITPEEIKGKGIAPFRANLCKNEMSKEGTGLSFASAINFYDASSKTLVKDFYYTYYHAPVKAKKGDVLILNVYHIKGDDCGYTFNLNANEYSQTFKTLYRSCYEKETDNLNIVKRVSTIEKKDALVNVSAKKIALPPSRVEFLLWDSLKRVPVEAEITVLKPKVIANLIQKEKGKFSFMLDKNTSYHLVFSAMGYKDAQITFMTGDSILSFSNHIYLVPYREGDNFVMDKIYFYANSPDMKPGSKPQLDKLVAYLGENPKVCIEIQGHTNGNKRIKKSYKANFTGSAKKLSQCRAEVIKKYLVEKGIAPDRLIATGYGGSRMIFPDPKNQWQADKNIRVEIRILSEKQTELSAK